MIENATMAQPLNALLHLLDDRSKAAVAKAHSTLQTADLAHLLRQGRSGLSACVNSVAPVLPTGECVLLHAGQQQVWQALAAVGFGEPCMPLAWVATVRG